MVHPIKVLVVDDEPPITEMIRVWLAHDSYEVHTALSGTEGLRCFFAQQPDIVVLDIMMPGMNGYELARRIREVADTPIIFLTARTLEDDVVKGFNAGGDDYVVKPVGLREFQARIEALLRRTLAGRSPAIESLYDDGAVAVDYLRREVHVTGNKLDLTNIEYRLLTYFIRHAGQVVTYEDILSAVWGSGYESSGYVNWHVARLRRKMEKDPRTPKRIVTVRGIGYRYERSAAAI